MAQDRIEQPELPLTHEFLSIMLGVRRPGVAVGLNYLKRQGLITTRRSRITIVDRDGLKSHCHGSYGAAEAEYERMLGDNRLRPPVIRAPKV